MTDVPWNVSYGSSSTMNARWRPPLRQVAGWPSQPTGSMTPQPPSVCATFDLPPRSWAWPPRSRPTTPRSSGTPRGRLGPPTDCSSRRRSRPGSRRCQFRTGAWCGPTRSSTSSTASHWRQAQRAMRRGQGRCGRRRGRGIRRGRSLRPHGSRHSLRRTRPHAGVRYPRARLAGHHPPRRTQLPFQGRPRPFLETIYPQFGDPGVEPTPHLTLDVFRSSIPGASSSTSSRNTCATYSWPPSTG